MIRTSTIVTIIFVVTAGSFAGTPYTVVDTGQIRCYDSTREIVYPSPGKPNFGQDAQYAGNQPAYKDNGDGTVTDLNTQLIWTQNPGEKMIYSQIVAAAEKCKAAGYTDWRLPSIKELYSLIDFTGTDPDPRRTETSDQRPFINTDYFKFSYGSQQDGDRIIDSQFATATVYRGTTMFGSKTMFGVNFADGRIKGYPVDAKRQGPRGEKKYYALFVRSNPDYGKNNFRDNGDGTVTDLATGLTWMQIDSGSLKAGPHKDGKMNWTQALEWAENLTYAGHSDWRLPNAKELQSIVDYTRCPDVTNSAAIDPVFECTRIKNEGGKPDYPFYWTSTTHYGGTSAGVYIAFGRALGWMTDPRTGRRELLDVHGAGAQRSDPKAGDPKKFKYGRGPQGDVVRIYNFVRCVRGGKADPVTTGPELKKISSAANTKNRSRDLQSFKRQQRSIRNRPGRTGERRQLNPADPHGSDARGNQPPTPADFIRRLDKDGDGRVSQNEFDGPRDHFRIFDRNNDGYLTADEAPAGPPPNRRR